MNKDKNIKWVASKIAPSVKEVDYWIDLSADPRGSVIKYPGKDGWTPFNQTLSENEIKKMISAAFDKLDMIKVGKVNGKQLSTNDFTNADKNKLNSLKNYDDTELKSLIASLSDRVYNLEHNVA